MKLTPGQLRDVLDLSTETFRHWKKILPPLSGRNGYRPCFSLGDLLAVAIVKTLSEDLGVRVGMLASSAPSLFEICNRSSWAALERLVIVIQPGDRVMGASNLSGCTTEAASIVVPCRPIVEQLRHRLLLEQEETSQAQLRFPPSAITSEPWRRAASDREEGS